MYNIMSVFVNSAKNIIKLHLENLSVSELPMVLQWNNNILLDMDWTSSQFHVIFRELQNIDGPLVLIQTQIKIPLFLNHYKRNKTSNKNIFQNGR